MQIVSSKKFDEAPEATAAEPVVAELLDARFPVDGDAAGGNGNGPLSHLIAKRNEAGGVNSVEEGPSSEDAMPRELTLLTQAHRAIAEAHGLDDIKGIRDKAEAVRKYAQSAGLGLEIQNYAAEVKLRAERKAGELLGQLQLHGGDRKAQKADDRPKLEDIGITKDQSSRWQLTAAVPERDFEKYVTQTKSSHGEVTTAGLLRVAKEVVAKKRKKSKQKKASDKCSVPGESLETVGSLSDLVAQGRKFSCLYADPPWQYENRATRGSAEDHYATMTVDELAALPVMSLLDENAHLHLWVTNGFLFDAQRLMEAWGFSYKSCFVWVKPQMGMGNYWRVSHEFLLLGVRGSLSFLDNSVMSWIRSDRTSHSSKPDGVRRLVERVSPGPYLELFGRKASAGWTVFGNEVAANKPGAT